MISKRIIVVLGLLLVGAFSQVAYTDAVRTQQNLQKQYQKIENLNTESTKIDQKLNETIETKEKSQDEIQNLKQQERELEEQRKLKEKELLSSVRNGERNA